MPKPYKRSTIAVSTIEIPNPKQNGSSSKGRAGWYPYYAGYCPRFVEQLIAIADMESGSTILDPWNGAGTTSQVASDMGFRGIGFDLNPAVSVVAKARLLKPGSAQSLRKFLEKIIKSARSYRKEKYFDDEPLECWFKRRSAVAVRHIDRAIRNEFSRDMPVEPFAQSYLELPETACFFYTVLFCVLRNICKQFRASNPTWLKNSISTERRIHVTEAKLLELYSNTTENMIHALAEDTASRFAVPDGTQIGVAAADSLPLDENLIDFVITSPPYCTRIDYAIATALELAVVGFGVGTSFRDLRDRMTGTSTIRKLITKQHENWGEACNSLLNEVASHKSKASKSYYFKTLLQYFGDIYASMEELNRCLARFGQCVFVVQDSFYKDIHVELPKIIVQMAAHFNWHLRCQRDFTVARSMRLVNSKSRAYSPKACATESVLWFQKRG